MLAEAVDEDYFAEPRARAVEEQPATTTTTEEENFVTTTTTPPPPPPNPKPKPNPNETEDAFFSEEDLLVECEVCYETVRKAVRCVGTKRHACCAACAETFVATKLGEGNPVLRCVSVHDCGANWNVRDVEAVLPASLLRQRDDMLAKSELAKAKLPHVVSCPFCPFAVQVSPDVLQSRDDVDVLECEHPRCGKRSCVRCKAELSDGFLHACDGRADDEPSSEGGVVRSCPAQGCDALFLKERGCNRLKCPTCGTLSCFLCRGTVKDYSHFCFCDCDISRRGHITRGLRLGRSERCRRCGKCSLWFDSAEEDDASVASSSSRKVRRFLARGASESLLFLGIGGPTGPRLVEDDDVARAARRGPPPPPPARPAPPDAPLPPKQRWWNRGPWWEADPEPVAADCC